MERNDKQELPPLFRRHVRRPRLTRLLDETNAKAIVLTAPAGYGKTTLAAEWLQGKENVVWYNATAASQDVAAFVTQLVKRARAGVSPEIQQCLGVPNPTGRTIRTLAELVGAVLHQGRRGSLTVIDDYQAVGASSEVEEFLDWLLRLSPARLLVTTRRRPRWVTARRLLHRDVLELGHEQLRMTETETNEVLKGLSRNSVQALATSARGWPALIGLGAVAARASLPDAFVADALYDYLAEEILREHEPNVVDLMVRASVLPVVDPGTCHRVLGVEAADELVATAKNSGLLQDYGAGAHFHPLLRQLLFRRLQDDPNLMARVVSKAIAAYRDAGDWDEAFDVAVRAGQPGVAAEILDDATDDLLKSGRVATLESWLTSCGPAAYGAAGRLAQAQVLLRRGRFLEADQVARDLIEGVPAEPVNLSRAYWVRGQAAHLLSAYEEAFGQHDSALSCAGSQDDHARAAWGKFVAAVELDRDDLEEHLKAVEGTLGPDLDSRLRLEIGRLLASERRGSLQGVWPRAGPVLELVSHCADPMIRAGVLTTFAYASNIRGDYQAARALAHDAVTFVRDVSLDFAVGFALSTRAEAETALRDLDSARRTEGELAAATARHEDPHLHVDLEIIRLKIALTEGGANGVPASNDVFADESVPAVPYGEYRVLLALVQAASGDSRSARKAVDRGGSIAPTASVTPLVEAVRLIGDFVEGASKSAAQASFLRLLRSAQAADCLGTLVWAYRAFPQLASLVEPGSHAAHLFGRLLRNANDRTLAQEQHVGWAFSDADDILSGLTRREKEVYRLVIRGLSNQEVASRLVISESTAKVHVARILKKLGKRSRIQLVLDAESALDREKLTTW